MARPQVGVDIGTSSIRAVVVDPQVGSDGFAKLLKVAEERLPHGAASGGTITNPTVVARALRRLFSDNRLPKRTVIVGYNHPNAAVAWRHVPTPIGQDKRREHLRLAAGHLSSRVDASEAQLSFATVRTEAGPDGDEADLVVVAGVAPEPYKQLLTVCQLAGINPRAVDLTPVALHRALSRVTADDEAPLAIVDIGATTTCVSVRQGLHVRSMRVIERGGDHLTDALKITFTSHDDELDIQAEAEKVKRRLRIGSGSAERLSAASAAAVSDYLGGSPVAAAADLSEHEEAITRAAELLVSEISNTLDHDAREHRDRGARAVVLTGRAAQQKGLDQRLADTSGRQVALGVAWVRPGRKVAADPELVHQDGPDKGELTVDARCRLAPAIGLALWNGGKH